MKLKRDAQTKQVHLPAFFTVGALAQLGNVSAHMMRRMLQMRGVRGMRAGTRVLIPLCEIEEKIPKLLESLQLLESKRRARQGEKGPR